MESWEMENDPHDDSPRDGQSVYRPDSDHFVVISSTPFHKIPAVNPFTTPKFRENIRCDRIDLNYDIIPAIICSLCLVFGILYCFFGYRYFKSTMFATGFLFGSLVTYLICLEENFLPLEGKIGVAVGSGILCGLITMLVQYVGLFMTGFHLGLLLAVAGLIVAEWFVHPDTKWVPIGAVLGTGLTCALLCLRFQRAVTFLSTAVLGSAMLTVGVDYFVNHFGVLYHSLDRLKATKSPHLCWFSWLVLALWPLASVLGCVVQCQLTGKDSDHREGQRFFKGVGIRRSLKPSNHHSVQSQHHNSKSKETSFSSSLSSHNQPSKPRNYRHLYQVRRFNGDVLAKNYVCRVHEGSSSADPVTLAGC